MLYSRRNQSWRSMLASASLLLATGCASLESQQSNQAALSDIDLQLRGLSEELAIARTELGTFQSKQDQLVEHHSTILEQLNDRVGAMPDELKKLCPPLARPSLGKCKEATAVKSVYVNSDKLVVGELERVWLTAPEKALIARMDTGASSSSIHAENLVEFERDGKDWVRFDCPIEGETISLEREVVRYVRVVQQSDRSGTRRPIINLRLSLGNIEDSFEFTLADRSHLEQSIILGRNFLTDIALVDVSKQFIQTQLKKKN